MIYSTSWAQRALVFSTDKSAAAVMVGKPRTAARMYTPIINLDTYHGLYGLFDTSFYSRCD